VQGDERRALGALGELEQAVMSVLWLHAPASVREVGELVNRGLAYTTIMTPWTASTKRVYSNDTSARTCFFLHT